MGMKEQVVHINCVLPLLQKDTSEQGPLTWSPPLLESGKADDCHSDDHEIGNSIVPMRTTCSGHVV